MLGYYIDGGVICDKIMLYFYGNSLRKSGNFFFNDVMIVGEYGNVNCFY